MKPGMSLVHGASGHFRVFISAPGQPLRDLTTFRGVPTTINSFSTADPFGDSTASLAFPAITPFDRPGSGELSWLLPWSRIEIRWYEQTGQTSAATSWVWEGNLVSEEIGEDYSVSAKGALYMADNYLAAPFFPEYPIPYEALIARLLDPRTHPTTGNLGLKIVWPGGWNVKVKAVNEPGYLWFLRPWKVRVGAPWSGLTTRSTGAWEPVLTGFVQSLLTTMYSPEGDQWTVMKEPGRRPVLKVRSSLRDADDAVGYVIPHGLPGVKVNLSRDFTVSANVIFGEGTDISGTGYNGGQVSADGSTFSYAPFAALPGVYPSVASNKRLVKSLVRKDAKMSFTTGVDELSARESAVAQISKFADPGYTGTITLDIDPLVGGQPVNRLLISAGSTVLLTGFRGTDVLFFVSSTEASPSSGTMSLTVDTKFRDALTVAEIRARTRDALDPTHSMRVGSQSAIVSDMLKPWSYAEGSGVIPSGSKLDATPFFKKMDPSLTFPWTSWTARYPPRSYPQYYIKASRKSAKAADRWQDNGWTGSAKRSLGVPIKAAQHGDIILTQIMAVDRNGHPVKIRFHFGIYANSGVNTLSMPTIPANVKNQPYQPGDEYPFFPDAFEQFKQSGEEQASGAGGVLLAEGVDLQVAWGSYYEPAGYSPGLASAHAAKTGMLIDDTSWTFDTTQDKNFSRTSTKDNTTSRTVGQLYAMIFQDDLPEAYFIGRLWRKPAGST